VNRIKWDARPSAADEVYAHNTTVSFIDALWELFMPLTRGQRVAIMSKAISKDPRQLMQTLAADGASRIVLVPSLLQALLESEEDLHQQAPLLRYWACSGEPLPAELAQRFATQLPQAVLLNIYGTSEFWDASWYDVGRGLNAHGVPIGRPISNVQVYVLDAQLQPTPIGAHGELHVGGAGLARGYAHLPGLTAERFIADPFGSGKRLYRTGDLARWRADGELEYLGRVDHQVKVRGYRIELGEIEAALRGDAGVKDCVVVAREDAPGDKRLVAYVVGEGETAPDSNGLRAQLKKSLPEYMVPSTVVRLARLPLTPNGKVDRRALPAPEGRPEVTAYVAPRTPIEEAVAAIWCEVLKLDKVGIDDNFFELGGHSLLATRVIARLREVFEVELPMRMLFQATTVRSLALLIINLLSESLRLTNSYEILDEVYASG
jgi:acyl-coenzyme A synthetase/AMP-(fatty) acid ligase/acyl carrier protein